MQNFNAIRISDSVQAALDHGQPVVALESTIITHGLPQPQNFEVAMEAEEIARENGATPATIGVYKGEPVVGLSEAEIQDMATDPEVLKASIRDLAYMKTAGRSAGTTIAATALLANRAGIDVFATGGLGGVHHGAAQTFDESADLVALSKISFILVSSGAKAILDIPATLERFETLSVPVIGYRTDTYPGFYVADSGFPVSHRVESPEEVARMLMVQRSLGIGTAINVGNPVPLEEQLDPDLLAKILDQAWADAEKDGIKGQQVTPYLLDYIRRGTGDESLRANVALYRNNIRLGAQIAQAVCTEEA
ncbi:MAG: pseudouridine-5'-phosphate glycosidase [Arcanobacterium sp.]|nr:pseudouridine-5'-phosphate glycosidase [Arcanobacterium sp.]MDY5589264.1 pseudouridine-5'-phosphate glycosidase [Arcanobacterium sp.]